jgi:hypothetical protein
VHPPLARRPRIDEGGRAFGRFVGLDAEAGKDGWDMRKDHKSEYSPIFVFGQVEEE